MLPIETYIMNQYIKSAEKRGFKFQLTPDNFLVMIDLPCVYCGAVHSNEAKRNQYSVKTRRYNGIDRINSDQDYTISNTVSCCGACNSAKSDQDVADFMKSEWLIARKAEIAAQE